MSLSSLLLRHLALFFLQAFMGLKIDPSTIVMDFELEMMNADKGRYQLRFMYISNTSNACIS
jgi:hypothetical protein